MNMDMFTPERITHIHCAWPIPCTGDSILWFTYPPSIYDQELMSATKRHKGVSNYHKISWPHPLLNLVPPKRAL